MNSLVTLLGLDPGKTYLSIKKWWKLKVSIVYLLSWAKRIWPEEFEDV